MTQQNVFETSAPSAPAGNAAFISATTAPPTFVFKPGVTFPDAGPVRQNVYNTAGLALLLGVLLGQGLSPAIPLPSSLVECDFSGVSQSFSLTANLTLSTNCTLRGINGGVTQPLITTAGHVISGLTVLDGIHIAPSVSTTVTESVANLTLTNNAKISPSFSAAIYHTVVAAAMTVNLRNGASIGGGSQPTFSVPSGKTLTIVASTNSTISPNGAVSTGGGVIIIQLLDSSVNLDASFYTNPDVELQFLYDAPTTITYESGAVQSPGVFTDFATACGYLNAVEASSGSDFISATIIIPASSETISPGSYSLPTNVVIEGLWNETYPILAISAGVTLGGNLTKLTFRNFENVSFANTAGGVVSLAGQIFFLIIDNAALTNSGTSGIISAASSSFQVDILNQDDFVTGTPISGLLAFVNASSQFLVNLFGTSILPAGLFSYSGTPGATGSIASYSASAYIDPSYYTPSADVSLNVVIGAYVPAPFVLYEDSGDDRTSFTNFAQLVGYINAIAEGSITTVVPEWTIQIAPAATSVTIPAGTYNIQTSSIVFKGIIDTDTAVNGPTLNFANGVVFDPPVPNIEFIDCVAHFNSTGTPFLTFSAPGVSARFQSNTQVNQSGTAPVVRVETGAYLAVTLEGGGVATCAGSTPIWHADNASDIDVYLSSFSQLKVHAALVDSGESGILTIHGDPTCAIDTSYFTASSTIVDTYGVTVLPFAERLTTGASGGALFCATDGFTSVWQPVLSKWQALVGGTVCPEPPLASNFVQLNGTTATLVDAAGTLVYTWATGNEIFQDQTTPLNPQFNVTVAFSSLWNPGSGGGHEAFFALALSTTTTTGPFKRIGFYVTSTGDVHFQYQWFNSISSGAAPQFDVTVNNLLPTGSILWFKCVQDSTHFTVFYSANGREYRQIWQEAANTFNVPGYAGLYNQDASGNTNTATVYSMTIA